MARGKGRAALPAGENFVIDGGDELLAKLEAMVTDVRAVLDDAVEEGARVIQTEANLHAPGPHIEIAQEAKGTDTVTLAIGPDKEHWYYTFGETGTSQHEVSPRGLRGLKGGAGALAFIGSMGAVITKKTLTIPALAARPFLRPAMDSQGDEAVEAVGARLRKEIEKHADD
jgi:HK97 gp10 family phage protein